MEEKKDKKRSIGYYWCKDGDEWSIAYWDGLHWVLFGAHYLYSDRLWDEIDETPITRKVDCPATSRYFEGSKPLTDFEQAVLNDTIQRTAKTKSTLSGRK